MGSNFATELSDSEIDLQTQIRIQLTNNHYPPVPTSMVKPCIAGINACNAGMPDTLIALPDGVTWKGKPAAPASAIVEAHHLEAWLKGEE